jgi:hypothetical protein
MHFIRCGDKLSVTILKYINLITKVVFIFSQYRKNRPYNFLIGDEGSGRERVAIFGRFKCLLREKHILMKFKPA